MEKTPNLRQTMKREGSQRHQAKYAYREVLGMPWDTEISQLTLNVCKVIAKGL